MNVIALPASAAGIPTAMKAVFARHPGPAENLELVNMPTPQPGDGEVLVKVHAATVTAGDVLLRGVRFPLSLLLRALGFRRQTTPGTEFAGIVVAAGAGVTRFRVGDRVFGTTTGRGAGANAEYVLLPEEWQRGSIEPMPEGIGFAEAAALPVGAMTALHFLRIAGIERGDAVLVHGASGSVGTYAVQIAKHLGAKVTAVTSTGNADLVRSIGANRTIDYRTEDFTRDGPVYDIVFDAAGKVRTADAKSVLKPDGRIASVRSMKTAKKHVLADIARLAAEGAIRPVIDRTYPLVEIVDAHRYVETGHKTGNVVIGVAGS